MPGEFLVNDILANNQRQPDVLALPDGTFLIVWESFFDVAAGSGYFIGGQRYTADGTRIGDNIIFDARADSDFRYVDVTLLDDGGFVLAYEDGAFSDVDPDTIFVRVFNSDFSERTSGRVQTIAPNIDQTQTPEVVALDGGGFMLLSTVRGDTPGIATNIYARLFDANGVAQGNGFQLNTTANDSEQFNPFAARLENDNVIVVWDSDNTGTTPGGMFSVDEIRGSLLSSNGTELRSDFVLVPNSGRVVSVHNTDLSVTALRDGGFAITYFSSVEIGGDDVGSIAWRTYNASGNPTSPEYTAFALPGVVPDNGNIVELSGGQILVVWDYPGDSFADAVGRVFSRTGVPLSDILEFTDNDANNQEYPRIAALADGGFVVTYETDTLDFNDPDIAARVYDSSVYDDNPPINGTNNGETLDGTVFADEINGLGGNDVINGLAGDDTIAGGTGNDRLNGNRGDDEIAGGAGNDFIDGGTGRDMLSYASADGGVNVYMQFSGRNVGGGQGRDTFVNVEDLTGSRFADRLIGNTGSNDIRGGDGNDLLKGKGGSDRFWGNAGDDRLLGGDDAEYLNGGSGADVLLGLGGDDALIGDFESNPESGSSDFLYGGRGSDRLVGGGGDDRLRGNRDADLLQGQNGADDLRGGGGNDTLLGGVGTDYLLGEGGSDHLLGGSGDDVLVGGFGGGSLDGARDTFVFAGNSGDDRIRDFENGIDQIDLTDFEFSNFTSQVKPLASNSGSTMILDLGGGNSVEVLNFSVAEFTSDDVLL